MKSEKYMNHGFVVVELSGVVVVETQAQQASIAAAIART